MEVVGSGGSGDTNKGSLRKSFFMSRQELDSQLKQILNNGFSEEFIIGCAEKFEKAEFPPQKKSIARLYLFYLSGVMKSVVTENALWTNVIAQIGIFASADEIPARAMRLVVDSGLDEEPENIALAIGAHCYAYVFQNKKSGEDFLTLFVRIWFNYFALS